MWCSWRCDCERHKPAICTPPKPKPKEDHIAIYSTSAFYGKPVIYPTSAFSVFDNKQLSYMFESRFYAHIYQIVPAKCVIFYINDIEVSFFLQFQTYYL